MLKDKIQKLIFEALLTLLNKNSFEVITVDMICKEAAVSRSTFYRKFKDKYAVLLWEISFLYEIFDNLEMEKINIGNSYVLAYDFMLDRKDYMRKLIKIKGQNSYGNFMFSLSVNYLNEAIRKMEEPHINKRIEYLIEMFANNIVYATEKWVENDFEESSDEMAEILLASMPELLKKDLV